MRLLNCFSRVSRRSDFIQIEIKFHCYFTNFKGDHLYFLLLLNFSYHEFCLFKCVAKRIFKQNIVSYSWNNFEVAKPV